MTEERLNKLYFTWMCRLVRNDDYLNRSFLLKRLHNTDFSCMLEMDGNRADDGINLRYRFGREIDCHEVEIAAYLDNRPCSVLEMMVALALRCEEEVIGEDVEGELSRWFWGMIENLGLGDMSDDCYDRDYVDFVISRFLEREYEPDGDGGLFKVENCQYDLRTVEIWYQACWYMNEKYKRKEDWL